MKLYPVTIALAKRTVVVVVGRCHRCDKELARISSLLLVPSADPLLLFSAAQSDRHEKRTRTKSVQWRGDMRKRKAKQKNKVGC